MSWRPLAPADLPALAAAAALVHPDLPERPEVFAEKLRLYPDGCRACETGGNFCGYALAHPWALDAVPKLDSFLGGLPPSPGCLYLHDAALLPAARGRGAACELVEYLAALARGRGLPALALTAVYGTQALWSRYGFAEKDLPSLRPALAAYGGGRYMVRIL